MPRVVAASLAFQQACLYLDNGPYWTKQRVII